MPSGDEPIDDGELLFRRIPSVWFRDGKIEPEAFLPRKNGDEDGISLSRGKYKSPEEAARPPVIRPGKVYYLSQFKATELRKVGLEAVPMPLPNDIGHCVIPQMTSEKRRTDECREFARLLAVQIGAEDPLGPFGPFDET